MFKILMILLIVLLVLVVLYLLAMMPRMINRPDRTPMEGVYYAHRGLFTNGSSAPENSLPAFTKAVQAGYGIELDVQLTKDEVMVVFHDFTLKRMCGVDKKVEELTFQELKKLTLLDSGEHIPTFQEVLALIDGRVPLIIEYKIPAFSVRVCELADALLQQYPGPYCIESFHPMAVRWYRKNRGEIIRGILVDSYIKEGYKDVPFVLYAVLHNLLFNFLIKPDFIAFNAKYPRDFSRRLCYKLFRSIAVAWTIRSQEQLDALQEEFDWFIFEGFIPR